MLAQRYVRMTAVILTAAALSLTGCAKKATQTPPTPPATPPAGTGPGGTTPTPGGTTPGGTTVPSGTATVKDLQVVYFGYDSATLDDAARAALDANARLLRENAGMNVTIEGHCDERGTVEYNLALGQRRAESVMQYMVDAGVSASRLKVVTYGKERPAVEGSDESSWARNRRAEFSQP